MGTDLGRWQFFWEFNKDAHIALRDAIALGRATSGSDADFLGGGGNAVDIQPPTLGEVRSLILPALSAALRGQHQRDIVSGAMMALAKCAGAADPANPVDLDLFRVRLSSPDQEVRETAALCLGLAGNPDAFGDLRSLLHGSRAGAALAGREAVDVRSRSFAAYGMALLARQVPRTLPAVRAEFLVYLDPARDVPRDLRVAALHGCRLVASEDHSGTPNPELVSKLVAYYNANLGAGESWIQAHVPAALAACMGSGDSDQHREMLDLLTQDLSGDRGIALAQSAAQSMGQLIEDPAGNSAHEPYGRALLQAAQSADDQQTRCFALISLGSLQWAPARDYLLKTACEGAQLDRTWAALSLGLGHRGGSAVGPKGVARVQRAFEDARNPEERSGFAVALGLMGAKDAVGAMRDQLERYSHQDGYAGYLCIALSLLEDRSSVPQLRELLDHSARRPEVVMQAAVALGRMGDGTLTGRLLDLLQNGDGGVAVVGGVASALGRIGDSRSIKPLIAMLGDGEQQPLSRAFAAVALGGIGDRRSVQWNAAIAQDINYRAAVSTLTDQAMGILDLF